MGDRPNRASHVFTCPLPDWCLPPCAYSCPLIPHRLIHPPTSALFLLTSLFSLGTWLGSRHCSRVRPSAVPVRLARACCTR